MNRYQCPFCGKIFGRLKGGLIPVHGDTVTGAAFMSSAALECGADQEFIECPGSQQGPRNPDSDRRPLWKDGGVK